MKKGTEVWSDFDHTGRLCLRAKKAKGRFTLDEITDIAREWEENFYVVIINATAGEEEEDVTGDFVTLYSAEKFFEN